MVLRGLRQLLIQLLDLPAQQFYLLQTLPEQKPVLGIQFPRQRLFEGGLFFAQRSTGFPGQHRHIRFPVSD